MKITSVFARPLDRYRNIIKFSVENIFTNLTYYASLYEITGSEARVISTVNIVDYDYIIDHSKEPTSVQKKYRLTLWSKTQDNPDDTREFVSVGVLDGAILRLKQKYYKQLWLKSGSPVIVARIKKAGLRCPVCYDPITKQSKKSECSACYGTGFAGGYYKPFADAAIITKTAKQLSNDSGPTDRAPYSIIISPKVPVDKGDLIYSYLKDEAYRIVRVDTLSKNDYPYAYNIVATLVPRNSIVYSLFRKEFDCDSVGVWKNVC